MGFYSGRVSFLRFKVSGAAPRVFAEEHLDRLSDRQAGRQRIASADGIETGWTAGDHILDTDFQLAKNIINDTLTFDLRVDVDKLPNDLLRAYFAVELKALSKKDRKSTRLNSSHSQISYAVFCLKKITTRRSASSI